MARKGKQSSPAGVVGNAGINAAVGERRQLTGSQGNYEIALTVPAPLQLPVDRHVSVAKRGEDAFRDRD